MSKFIDTLKFIQDYKDLGSNEEFPTMYDYALYVCGGDFTSFDDGNLLAVEMYRDEHDKGIPTI